MAVKTTTIVQTTVTDDLDGKELSEDAKAIHFGWGGRRYEIYLSEQHYTAFEKALTKYVDAAKDVTTQARAAQSTPRRTSTNGRTAADKELSQAVREWAQSTGKAKVEAAGFKVPGDRGRIAQGIQDLFADK